MFPPMSPLTERARAQGEIAELERGIAWENMQVNVSLTRRIHMWVIECWRRRPTVQSPAQPCPPRQEPCVDAFAGS
jgi:hypothetical protein